MQTIAEYVKAARVMLQDNVAAQRYQDEAYILALQLAFDEAYRIRPDMFTKLDDVVLVGVPETTNVPVPRGYQSAFLYYMCGHVQMQDVEDTQDNRASIFLNKFTAQLLVSAS